MKTDELLIKIESIAAEILETGDSAPKLYLRVRPNGDIDVTRETSWCCSEDEYYKRVPHTLSLEIVKSTRDYSNLSEAEIEECAEYAHDAAEELMEGWKSAITEWITAGNLEA